MTRLRPGPDGGTSIRVRLDLRNFDSNFVRQSDKRGEWTSDTESMSDVQRVAYHFCTLLAWEDGDERVREICTDRLNLKLTGAVGG